MLHNRTVNRTKWGLLVQPPAPPRQLFTTAIHTFRQAGMQSVISTLCRVPDLHISHCSLVMDDKSLF